MPAVKNTVEAKVAGDALVVSFGGDAPKVWRADMARLAAASFELGDEGGRTSLVLETERGRETVQSFSARGDAVAALNAVTGALLSHEKPAPPPLYAPHPHHHRAGIVGRVFKTVFWLFIVIVCVTLLYVIVRPRPVNVEGAAGMNAPVAGQPVPADEVFGK